MLFKASPCTQKFFWGLKTISWLTSSKNIRFLLFTIFSLACPFCFRSARKCLTLSLSKSGNFWQKVESNKTRDWSGALLTSSFFWQTTRSTFAHQKFQEFIMPEKQVKISHEKGITKIFWPKIDAQKTIHWSGALPTTNFLTDYREHFCRAECSRVHNAGTASK